MGKVLVLKAETLEFEEVKVKGELVSYQVMRTAVEGFIEHIIFNRDLDRVGIDMWCNEEGKLNDLKPSIAVVEVKKPALVELLAGNILFTKSKGDEETYALSDDDIKLIKETIKSQIKITSTNNKGERVVETVRMLPYK